jgi:hydroxyacylglutathione hydrolase
VKELAPGVWQLRQPLPDAINVYLLEDVLLDAATRYAKRRILRELRGREVNAHALTHAHPDHQGRARSSASGSGFRSG